MARHAYTEHSKAWEGDVWYLPHFARFMRSVRNRWVPITDMTTDMTTDGSPRHAAEG